MNMTTMRTINQLAGTNIVAAAMLAKAPTPAPSPELIDLADYIGCLRIGVSPPPAMRDRVAVVLARVSAWKAANQ
jgi:hypothetical protein